MGLPSWLPVKKGQLQADIIAGLTVGFLLIPQSMAYAELAGLPSFYGLYAAFIPVIIGALFGHLHQLGIGPTAMTSILTASVLSSQAVPGSAEYIQLAITLAFCVGALRLLLGFLRLASITNLVSYPVIAGFTNAGALIIISSQFSKVFGVSTVRHTEILGSVKDLGVFFTQLPETIPVTLIIAVLSGILIIIVKKKLPKFPIVLVVLALSIIISRLISYPEISNGAVVGNIPEGLPKIMFIGRDSFSIKTVFQDIVKVFPGSILVTLISMMEVLSVSKAVSYHTKQKMNLNQELIGQGLAALIGSFFQAFPTGGSFSRTALNLNSHSKSGLNILISGVFVMIILLFLTPLLFFLPLSVLGITIIISALTLFKPSQIIGQFRYSFNDGMVCFLTFAATIFFAPAIHNGIIIGISLSLLLFMTKSMKPNIAILGRHNDGTMRNIKHHDLKTDPDIIMLRFDSSITFVTAEAFEQSIINASAEHKEAKSLLLSAESVNHIDSTGIHTFSQVLDHLTKENLTLYIAGLKSAPYRILERSGIIDIIGSDNIFRNQETALKFIENR